MKQYKFEYEFMMPEPFGRQRRTIRTTSNNLRGAVRKAIIHCRIKHGKEFMGLTKVL